MILRRNSVYVSKQHYSLVLIIAVFSARYERNC